MARCRSCQARIVWAKTVAGKSCPLDADAVTGAPIEMAGGGLVLVTDNGPDGRIVRAEHGAYGFRSHFASCPDAKAHRKAR